MDITPDLLYLNIHNPFTNERISVYLDIHSRMFLGTKDVKQISHLSKGVVIVASSQCQLPALFYSKESVDYWLRGLYPGSFKNKGAQLRFRRLQP